MKYFSTRNKNIVVSSKEAIRNGLAEDGGLFLPITFPHVLPLEVLSSYSYLELAHHIVSLFFDDYSEEEIHECVYHAYDSKFDTSEITPVTYFDDCAMVELFHGPTYAFKDVALSFLPQVMKLTASDNRILILTATSGDTGKAALEGFKDVENIHIVVCYPEDGVSSIQKKQMQTSLGNNVSVFAIQGNFDDCQKLVKQAYSDSSIQEALGSMTLSSANSINIGRLIPQIVYYFYSYFRLVESEKISLYDEVDFVVPTGNFGDILAGYFAKQIGLPIHQLICASNSNHVLSDFIKTGVYNRNRSFFETISPSMDILVSSNLERLLYLTCEDDEMVKNLMHRLEKEGSYTITDKMKQKIQETFVGYWASEEDCKKEIFARYQKDGILVDPHTSVALSALRKHKEETNSLYPTIVLSTASIFKFPNAILESLHEEVPSDAFEALDKLSQIAKQEIPFNIRKLKNAPIRFSDSVSKEDAISYLASLIKEVHQNDY
ncbi:MAG: threonine synthase [Solobacterium sp.]|nr:threonine synthase [Solobacterium sp.]